MTPLTTPIAARYSDLTGNTPERVNLTRASLNLDKDLIVGRNGISLN